MHELHHLSNLPQLESDNETIVAWWPEWTLEALCRDYPPEWFYEYGRNKRKINRAKSVCHHCPVLAQCLRDNLTVPDGIFAGMTWLERWRFLGNTGYPPRHNAYQFFAEPFTVFKGKFVKRSNPVDSDHRKPRGFSKK